MELKKQKNTFKDMSIKLTYCFGCIIKYDHFFILLKIIILV